MFFSNINLKYYCEFIFFFFSIYFFFILFTFDFIIVYFSNFRGSKNGGSMELVHIFHLWECFA